MFGVRRMLWMGRMLRVLGVVGVARQIHEMSPWWEETTSVRPTDAPQKAVTLQHDIAPVESHALRLVAQRLTAMLRVTMGLIP